MSDNGNLKDENKVELKNVILCAVRNPKSGLGISVFVGNCKRSELDLAIAELQHLVHKRLIHMDIISELKKDTNKIIKPKHGILDFVRRRK